MKVAGLSCSGASDYKRDEFFGVQNYLIPYFLENLNFETTYGRGYVHFSSFLSFGRSVVVERHLQKTFMMLEMYHVAVYSESRFRLSFVTLFTGVCPNIT